MPVITKKDLNIFRGTYQECKAQPTENMTIYFAWDTNEIFVGNARGEKVPYGVPRSMMERLKYELSTDEKLKTDLSKIIFESPEFKNEFNAEFKIVHDEMENHKNDVSSEINEFKSITNNNINSLNTKIDENYNKLTSDIEKVNNSLNAYKNEANTLINQNKSELLLKIEAETTERENSVNNITNTLETINNNINLLDTRIDENYNELTNNIEKIQEQINENKNSITTVSNKVSSLENNLDGVIEDRITTKLNEFDKTIQEKIDEKLSNFDTSGLVSNEKFETEIGAIKAKDTQLESSITSLKNTIDSFDFSNYVDNEKLNTELNNLKIEIKTEIQVPEPGIKKMNGTEMLTTTEGKDGDVVMCISDASDADIEYKKYSLYYFSETAHQFLPLASSSSSEKKTITANLSLSDNLSEIEINSSAPSTPWTITGSITNKEALKSVSFIVDGSLISSDINDSYSYTDSIIDYSKSGVHTAQLNAVAKDETTFVQYETDGNKSASFTIYIPMLYGTDDQNLTHSKFKTKLSVPANEDGSNNFYLYSETELQPIALGMPGEFENHEQVVKEVNGVDVNYHKYTLVGISGPTFELEIQKK